MTGPTGGRRPDLFLTGCALWRGPDGAWEITASSNGPEPGEVVVRAGTTSLGNDLDGLHLSVDRVHELLVDLASAGRVAACVVTIDGSATVKAHVSAAAVGVPDAAAAG